MRNFSNISTLSYSDAAKMEVLTTDDVARILKLDIQVVRKHAREGLLKGYKTKTGRWRFTWNDVAEYLGIEVNEIV